LLLLLPLDSVAISQVALLLHPRTLCCLLLTLAPLTKVIIICI
jgi:hypothetical protein